MIIKVKDGCFYTGLSGYRSTRYIFNRETTNFLKVYIKKQILKTLNIK